MPRHDYRLLSNPDLAKTGVAEWDSRFQNYVIRSSLAHADLTFGVYSMAEEAFDREQARLARIEAEHDIGDEVDAPERFNFARLQAAESVREESFLEPLWRAAAELVETPAPTIAAALFKISLTEFEDLSGGLYVTVDPMAVILDDLARLTGDPTHAAQAMLARGVFTDIGATERVLSDAALAS